MGKFGKKVVVDVDMSKYIIGVLGPSGFGKSTLLSQVAEKEFGDDGYIAIDFGQEDGYAAISGAIVEKCEDFPHFQAVVDDIVANKATDYPNLKVVILDTLDSGYECCESYTVKAYNREHREDPNFKKATSINSVEGGYGRGMDRCIATFKNELARLKSAGVGYWYTGHCKERDQTDLFTGATYTQLTTNMLGRYFNSIKDISHIIGFGYYDRNVEKVEVGKENPVTKKKKTREEIKTETRKIKFRDDGYLVDAKSRFADIVPEITLGADEFIKAIKDAIAAAGGKPTPKKATTPTPVVEKPTVEKPEIDDEPPFEVDDDATKKDALIVEIRGKFSKADVDTKKQIKKILIEKGNGNLENTLPMEVLEEINSIL